MRGEGEFLINHGDAEAAAVEWIAGGVGFAIEKHLAGVGCVGTGEGFHKGRFAGAVLADEGVDFAWHDGERDAIQRKGGAEGFFDVAHFEARSCGGLAHAYSL